MKIRQRTYRSGKVGWQLDLGVVEGKRVQRAFETKTEALEALARERKRRVAHGAMGGSLRPEEMVEFLHARQRLRESGAEVSIGEVVEWYLRQAPRRREGIAVPELVRRFRESRDELGLSQRYVGQLGVSLGSLARMFPLRLAHELTARDVRAWLDAGGWQAKTMNNYLGDVSAMMEWAMGKSRAYVTENVTLEIERRKWTRGAVRALSVGQCEELLREAVKQERWRVLAYLVLGMLGGIRPAEIERLRWDAIDLEERTVIVLATDAKTAARRVVDLTENAVAWLRCGMRKAERGMVIERKGWEDEWVVFRRSLGWEVGGVKRHLPKSEAQPVHGRWPHDALRHTFASMHYAMWQNEAALQVQMGHRSARMLHQHYRAVVKPEEARRFWGLRPE